MISGNSPRKLTWQSSWTPMELAFANRAQLRRVVFPGAKVGAAYLLLLRVRSDYTLFASKPIGHWHYAFTTPNQTIPMTPPKIIAAGAGSLNHMPPTKLVAVITTHQGSLASDEPLWYASSM